MFTIAGNPDGVHAELGRLTRAFESLIHGLARTSNVTRPRATPTSPCPAPSPCTQPLRPRVLPVFRSQHCHYSPPVFEPDDGILTRWETLLRLTGIVTARARTPTWRRPRRHGASTALQGSSRCPNRGSPGATPRSCSRSSPPTRPARLLDLMLPRGPYELTLGDIGQAHGIRPRPARAAHPGAARSRAERSSFAPEPLVADVARLQRVPLANGNGGVVLIGRRNCARTTPGCTTCPSSSAARSGDAARPSDTAAALYLDGTALSAREGATPGDSRCPSRSCAAAGSGWTCSVHRWRAADELGRLCIQELFERSWQAPDSTTPPLPLRRERDSSQPRESATSGRLGERVDLPDRRARA